MTKLEQAARQALEALEVSTDWDVGAKGKQLQSMKAITALREALAKQAEQEPVAWMNDSAPMGVFARNKEGAENFGCTIPLYAAPVRTKDLTDDEINEVLWRGGPFESVIDSIRAVIAADREKNK